MPRIARTPSRLVFAAAVLGALAFGASRALAAPREAAAGAYCQDGWCAKQCGGYGFCRNGVCLCY